MNEWIWAYHTDLTCFNRYMVECEFLFVVVVVLLASVLIDTWWNVNKSNIFLCFPLDSFNRYMVECELNLLLTAYRYLSGFNRYMVECEYSYNMQVVACAVVLIDTWWNVNTDQPVQRQILYLF